MLEETYLNSNFGYTMDQILVLFDTRALPQYLCSKRGFSPSGPKPMLCSYSQIKKFAPKAANDVKLICAGKVLENSRTVGQCKTPFGELPNGVITMHAVVQPSLAKAKSGRFPLLRNMLSFYVCFEQQCCTCKSYF